MELEGKKRASTFAGLAKAAIVVVVVVVKDEVVFVQLERIEVREVVGTKFVVAAAIAVAVVASAAVVAVLLAAAVVVVDGTVFGMVDIVIVQQAFEGVAEPAEVVHMEMTLAG